MDGVGIQGFKTRVPLPLLYNMGSYPNVSRLAGWSENCKCYSSLPLDAVVSLFYESSEFCHHNPLCCFSMSVYCCKLIFDYIRFDAFPASEYNEVFLGYQLGEVVQFSRDQRFEDHLCPRLQGRRNNLG
jgi:hypothetical protein